MLCTSRGFLRKAKESTNISPSAQSFLRPGTFLKNVRRSVKLEAIRANGMERAESAVPVVTDMPSPSLNAFSKIRNAVFPKEDLRNGPIPYIIRSTRKDEATMKGELTKPETSKPIPRRKGNRMLPSMLIMSVLAAGLLAFAFLRGKGEHLEGLKRSKDMVIEVFPLLILAYIVAGMVQVLLPRETVSHWVGRESGFRGIIMACIAGGMMPGGPYVVLPFAAGLLRAGAGIGAGVAFLTAWSLWSAGRLPIELGIMGLRFTVIRVACTCVFTPIAGLIARTLFERG
jgi:hypothetical protein